MATLGSRPQRDAAPPRQKMARALLLVALAAGAAALPQRLRASASPAKKAAHVHPRRAAPSLAALDASLGDLAGTLEK